MHRRFLTSLFPAWVVMLGILVVGCAGQLPDLPVIGTPGNHQPGKVVWHDLVTPDLEQAKSFYGALLGWKFEEVSSGYLLARNGDGPVAGLARLDSKEDGSYWLPLVSVADADQSERTARDAGGTVLLKPFDLGGRGRVAVLKDPQGAAFGVLQSSYGDPKDAVPQLNGWMWNEVWTQNVSASADFYRKLVGYEEDTTRIAGVSYTYLARDGVPRVGLITKSDPQIGNTWVAYLRVADVNAFTARAESLGATVLMAPNQKVRNGTVAILADPQGAGFVAQEWDK
jgi:predicted enzyme related to lactoylglutathione lyase